MLIVIVSLLALLVIALIMRVRALRKDVETLYGMVRNSAGSHDPVINVTAPQPDALDIARRLMDQHEVEFHKR